MRQYKEPNPNYMKIGEKIRQCRESQPGDDSTQENFAQRLGIKRATLSLIENGSQAVSADVLLKLSRYMSIDELLKMDVKRYIVIDTNVLLNRPTILEKAIRACDCVYVPGTVINELDGHTHSSNHQTRVTANLVRKSIIEYVDKYNEKIKINYNKEWEDGHLPDDMIFSLAINLAKTHESDNIYLLSNDRGFLLKENENLDNFKVITSNDYNTLFNEKNEDYSIKYSQEFCNAVYHRDIQNAERLLSKNINVNSIDSRSGYTPLIIAVRNRDLEMIDFLLKIPQLDVNAVDDKKHRLPAISHAIQIDNKGIVQKLINVGANINEPSANTKNPYNTPLMIASWHGKFDLVQILVENGACINQQDKGNGYTALIKATINNHKDIVKYLLKNNADTTICSFEKKSALDYALEKNDENRFREIIDMLKEATK